MQEEEKEGDKRRSGSIQTGHGQAKGCRKPGEGWGNEGGNRGSWLWKREEISLPVLVEHSNSTMGQPRPLVSHHYHA